MVTSTTVTPALRVIRTEKEINRPRVNMMRHLFLTLLLVWSGISVSAQSATDTLGGEVSFKTSQSIYVKFPSTKAIAVGDTLFLLKEESLIPAVLVKNTSSTSCVGVPLTDLPLDKGVKIIAKVKAAPAQTTADSTGVSSPLTNKIEEITTTEPVEKEEPKVITEKSDTKGRLMAAAYINFGENPLSNKQRMRYTLNFNSRRIGQTGLSAEAYMSFRNTLGEWQEVQDNFKKAFKVYSLALEYDFGKGTRVWAGRKVNFNISNIGAIDGVQAEKKWKKATVGAFAGSRPDLTDYGYNPKLFQYGAYVGNLVEGKNGTMQNTLAFVEQKYNGMTDRRFAYFQHLNSMIKRVSIFTSFEFDLYQFLNGQPKSTFDITSIYFSLRYRVSDKLSFFGSYDARNNVIYYESYKNFIDQLLEEETRQGFRFSFNYRPWKKITIGSNAGYRYQINNPGVSKNLNTYVTVSRIPGLQLAATASVLLIESAYLNGTIYGLRLSRDIIKGKLFGELEFRTVQYKYKNVEIPLNQSIFGTNLSWRISKLFSFSLNYEGELQNKKVNSRIYTNIIQRF